MENVRRNKNLLMVIDAVKLARASGLDVRLLVAGGYYRSNPYCLECMTAINGEPSAFINKTGFVDEAEIPELIKRTDAFILAYSDFDSQSGVAVPAGVNGRPVISSESRSNSQSHHPQLPAQFRNSTEHHSTNGEPQRRQADPNCLIILIGRALRASIFVFDQLGVESPMQSALGEVGIWTSRLTRF